MKTPLFNAAWLIASFVLARECRACTTFVLSDGNVVLFARNFDWDWGDGIVVVNQRDIEKTAFIAPPEKPARWTSKYGSVTFNQFGREMPYGGINEVGLVVEQMMLFESKYPKPDERPAVNMLQWIQYQLDNCQTVEEVIATDKFLRQTVPQGKQRIHYLICDASGNATTIEFLNGKMVYHDFLELTHDRHRNYLYGFFRKQDVKQTLGDLTPMAQGLLMTLKSYRPKIQK